VDVQVTVKNYRCFSDSPANFDLRNGLASFVGANNSGKSTLLRLFYELRNLFAALSQPGTLRQGLLGPAGFNDMPVIKDPSEIFCDRNGRDIVLQFAFRGPKPPTPTFVDKLDITISRGSRNFGLKLYKGGPVEIPPEQAPNFNINPQKIFFRQDPGSQGPIADLSPIIDLGNVLSRMLYLGPFRNAVNVGGANDYYDVQIGERFITSWRSLKTGYVKERREAAYRLTDDIRRILAFDSLGIDASDDAKTLQLMINGRTYGQSEIGSGLIQFILVLANAAIRRPSFILIDEPESNLHPSLQIDFLTTLASYADCGILFATHNLGLARAVSDVVYSVRKKDTQSEEREVRQLTGTKGLAEFLGEMGYNAYEDLGFETVLLVEGPTDVTCLQQLLRLYKKEHQIVLLQLGGGSMINGNREAELSEITRISPRVRAVIDSERTQAGAALSAERQAFVESCRRLNITCHVLQRRATENYLPAHAISKVKGPKYRALADYEVLESLQPAWGKQENWRIAREMVEGDLTGTDLGQFLQQL
jgi:ABC-type cobalamin/Fe3+-siderophores transport system ATPase subunit